MPFRSSMSEPGTFLLLKSSSRLDTNFCSVCLIFLPSLLSCELRDCSLRAVTNSPPMAHYHQCPLPGFPAPYLLLLFLYQTCLDCTSDVSRCSGGQTRPALMTPSVSPAVPRSFQSCTRVPFHHTLCVCCALFLWFCSFPFSLFFHLTLVCFTYTFIHLSIRPDSQVESAVLSSHV